MAFCWWADSGPRLQADRDVLGLQFDLGLILNHTLCMRTAKALMSQSICTGSHEPSLQDKSINTRFQCAGSFVLTSKKVKLVKQSMHSHTSLTVKPLVLNDKHRQQLNQRLIVITVRIWNKTCIVRFY